MAAAAAVAAAGRCDLPVVVVAVVVSRQLDAGEQRGQLLSRPTRKDVQRSWGLLELFWWDCC